MKKRRSGSLAGWVTIGGLAAIVAAILIATDNGPIGMFELLWQSILFLGVVCTLVGGFRWMLAKHNGNMRETIRGCAKVFLGMVLIILALLGVTVIGVAFAAPDIWGGRKPLPPGSGMKLVVAGIACAGMFCCGVYQLFRATFGQPRDIKVSSDGPQATVATPEDPKEVPQLESLDLRDGTVTDAGTPHKIDTTPIAQPHGNRSNERGEGGRHD